MSFETIELDISEGIASITLNRPDRLNALSFTMLRELSSALTTIADPDSGARCLLMSGRGRGFCSGADLIDIDKKNPDNPGDVGDQLDQLYHPMLRQIRNLPMPTVAAVSGPAAGGGMSLALTCDLVIAGNSATFLQAFCNIGLVPDMGSTYLLPRLIGLPRAREMALLGQKLPAPTAVEWGLIYKSVDDDSLMDEGRALAAKLAAGPTYALARIKSLLNSSPEADYDHQLELEALAQRECASSSDFKEGVDAFREKRPATFSGIR